jgi:hypothetical protein
MPFSNIDKPNKYFNTVLYTGNGTFPQAFTGVGFKPDFVWIKRRSATASHVLSDSVRGVTKTLYTDSTSAELTNNTYGWVSAFGSDGFSVDQSGSNGENVNFNGSTYASWNWLGANTTVSNTNGSITSTVSANTTSGFSIVGWTGTTGVATVGHGLGTTPDIIIIKNRSVVASWVVYHKSLGATKYLFLNLTSAQQTDSLAWNNTQPDSTKFTINNYTNGSGNNLIAYCFAEVKGYSKAFSYTGNGSADGNFVYCGFRPAFVLIKCTSNATDWFINDNKRLGYNGGNNVLYPDLSSAEATSPQVDILSNGFKTRTVDAMINNSGYTYVGFAFAEQPYVSSKGIVANAR